jgi:hypothetical protein
MVADRLRSMGVAMAFDDYYAGTSSQISIEMLERVAPERPDAIIVQTGVLHGLLELLALWDAGLVTVRAAANRRLGVLGGPLHRRLTAPLLRRYGRPCMAPYRPSRSRPSSTRCLPGSMRAIPVFPARCCRRTV